MTRSEEIRRRSGLNRSAFSRKYNIPFRTLSDWDAERRTAPDYVLDLLAYKVASEIVTPCAWAFCEYRDSRGTGSFKLFKEESDALEHAKACWEGLSETERRSYKASQGNDFFVAFLPLVWDAETEEYYPDTSAYTPIWDALAEE